MQVRLVINLILLAGIAAASVQQPWSTLGVVEANEHYRFDWPIQRVAIIGAGPSGISAYRELVEAGLTVRIFERDTVPGGNWHYTEEVPLDAPVPNAPPAIADFVPSLPPEDVELPYSQEFEDDGEIWRDHKGPKPIWESLISNMPSPIQQFPQWPWPPGTKWEISHYQFRNYIRSYASYLHINSNDENPAVAYNTRVELVEKRIGQAGLEQGWRLWLRSLEPTERNTYRATWWTEDFDAVVVAVGKYNAPSMPSIAGLAEWVERFPDLVRHSRQYRRREAYANQTVLVIGAGIRVSGTEIARDLNHHAKKVYLSYRHDHNKKVSSLEDRLRRVPKNTTFVGEIERFNLIPDGSSIQSALVELKNSTILSGIDNVILATGYRYSYPFLSQYYDGATYTPHPGSATTVSPFLPTDGSHIRDLYLDQFYLRDPTLAFLGFVPSYSALDYTALALAKVWTDTAKLPNSQAMQQWYNETVKERGGYGKDLLFLSPGRTLARIAYLIGWLNEAAVEYGGKQVDGLPKYIKEVSHYWKLAHFGRPQQPKEPEGDAVLASLGIIPTTGMVEEGHDDVIFYDDDW